MLGLQYRGTMYLAFMVFLSIGCAPGAQAQVSSQDVCSEAITINGICWRMTVPQMTQELESQGFNCNIIQFGYQCSGNSSMVLAIEESIYFSCEQFNACSIDFRDLAQAVAEQSPVNELRYEQTPFGGKYCGMGGLGDRVCVFAGNDMIRAWNETSRNFFRRNIIAIHQGAIGSGGIRLN